MIDPRIPEGLALLNFIREVEWLLNADNSEVTFAPHGCKADMVIDAEQAAKLHAEALIWIKRLGHLDKAV